MQALKENIEVTTSSGKKEIVEIIDGPMGVHSDEKTFVTVKTNQGLVTQISSRRNGNWIIDGDLNSAIESKVIECKTLGEMEDGARVLILALVGTDELCVDSCKVVRNEFDDLLISNSSMELIEVEPDQYCFLDNEVNRQFCAITLLEQL